MKSAESGVQYGSVGETVELVCEWVSMPVADKAGWRYNDFPVLGKTEHYQVLTRRHSTGSIVSTLIDSPSLLESCFVSFDPQRDRQSSAIP